MLGNLNKQTRRTMKELGLQMPVNKLYNTKRPSLKDAVVSFGGFCSGVVVSGDGLVFTELITNNAAAALAFPLALSISSQMGVSPMPFFVVICMAASASFSTPIGYQTNLIVQGIGNYKFTDFVRIGLPLNIITFLISIFLIPLIWPF